MLTLKICDFTGDNWSRYIIIRGKDYLLNLRRKPSKNSMIKYIEGNLFDSTCQTLVCAVNCVGVMGKGIALQFKTKFPMMFRRYEIVCKTGILKTEGICGFIVMHR